MTMMPHSRWSGLRAMPHGYGFAVKRSQTERPSSVASCLSWYSGEETVKRKPLHNVDRFLSEATQTGTNVNFQCQTDLENNCHESGFNISTVQRVTSSCGYFKDERPSEMTTGADHKCHFKYNESTKKENENPPISKFKLSSPLSSSKGATKHTSPDDNMINNTDQYKECSGYEVDSWHASEETKNNKDPGARVRYAVSYRQPLRKPRRVELRQDATHAPCRQSYSTNNRKHSIYKDNKYSTNDRENENIKSDSNFPVHQREEGSKSVTNGNKGVQFCNRSSACGSKSISSRNDVDCTCRCDICRNNNNNNIYRPVKNCWNVQSSCDVVRKNDFNHCCEFSSCITGGQNNSNNKYHKCTHACKGKCEQEADDEDLKKTKDAAVLHKSQVAQRPATADSSIVPYRSQRKDNRTNGQRASKSIYYNNPRVVYDTNLFVSDDDDASSVDVKFTTKLRITNRQNGVKQNAVDCKESGKHTLRSSTEEHHNEAQLTRGPQNIAGPRHTKEFTYQITSGNKWTPNDTHEKAQNLHEHNPSRDGPTYQSRGTSPLVESSLVQDLTLSPHNQSASCHDSAPRGTTNNRVSKTSDFATTMTLANKTDDVIEQILQSEDTFKKIVELAGTVRQQRASSSAGRRQKYSRMPVNTYGEEKWSKETQRTASTDGLQRVRSKDHYGRQSCEVYDKEISPRRVMTPHHVNLCLDVVPARVHGSRPIHSTRYN